MRRRAFALLLSLAACNGATTDEGGPPPSDAESSLDAFPEDDAIDANENETETALDASSDGDVGPLPDAQDARADAPFSPPSGTACEYAFFKRYFDKDNGPSYAALRDATFMHVVDRVAALDACGAKITLSGMLALMIYEGGGARVAFYNDRCAENSYDKSASCFTNPKARYSYQYGLAPVHTSNFHPCADVAYTSKMRARLEKAITDAGFSPTAAEIASVAADVHTFCPGVTPTLVDYYIVSTHAVFAVPKDGTGNDLKNAGKFPFFSPRVVIDLFFDEISAGGCAALSSDNQAIAIFGGSDASYKDPAKQASILKLYGDFKAASCP